MEKAVLLLSGGLDSSYNLFCAVRELDVAIALTFDYGQRAAPKEISASEKLCAILRIPHSVVQLPFFNHFTRTGLVNRQEPIPSGEQVSIDDMTVSNQSAKAVWIPNRNGILLNIAAGYAEGLGAKYIIAGFNAEEAQTFPDNSEDFMDRLNQSFSFSTANSVEVLSFSSALTKNEIVARGKEMDLPFQMLWPCYLGSEAPCGQCESCQRFERALRSQGLSL